jgi:hypothetical protein
MDVIDISFIVLLVITLLSTTKLTFLVWGVILLLGYAVLKMLFRREHLNNPRIAQVNADIAYLKSIGLSETSDNETMKARVAERARLEQTATAPVSTPLRDRPATPPAPQLPPVPAMKCSIENFGSI